jgi:hypothetical protein
MKNKQLIWPMSAILATCILVTLSMVMPGLLLRVTEENILDTPIVSQSYSAPVTSTTPLTYSMAQLTQTVQMYTQYISDSTVAKEGSNGSMSMGEAVKISITKITDIVQKGALLPLDGFPDTYAVDAQLRTITNDAAHLTMQYWSISFAISPALSSALPHKLTLSLDAQTGIILNLQADVPRLGQSDLAGAAKAFAQDINMPGSMVNLDQEQDYQKALWHFTNTSLSLQMDSARVDSGLDVSYTSFLIFLYSN